MSQESLRPSVNGALTYLSLLRQTERNSLQTWLFSPPSKKKSRQRRLTVVLLVALARIEETIEGLRVDVFSSCLMNVINFGCLLVMANSAALAPMLSFTTHSSPSFNLVILSIIIVSSHHFWDAKSTNIRPTSSCSAFSASICSKKEATDSSAVFCLAF